ncbi:MAG: molybdenum cofactor guanylyltransferase [Candidatus Latescibacter sp.]|nr:molybdenum cofactor guanylyltransferase [Candidatus Latescibacter sp.]
MKDKVKNVAAAVLAGGKNSRMAGQNKAFIDIHGVPIIKRTIDFLDEIFEEIIIVTNVTENFNLYEDKVLLTKDIFRDAGPLGGIHSALTHTSKDAVFVVACDMPFLSSHIIRTQTNCSTMLHCDCIVPRIGSCIEPLHAVYNKHVKDAVSEYIVNGNDKSIKNFLTTVNAYYLDLADNDSNRKIFCNVNTPHDLTVITGNYDGDLIK